MIITNVSDVCLAVTRSKVTGSLTMKSWNDSLSVIPASLLYNTLLIFTVIVNKY